VIFCRNVLIYFDRPTQARALAVLARLLTPTGMLFVGPAETSVVIEHDFRSAKLPLAFAFRKSEAMPAETRSPWVAPLPAWPAAAPRLVERPGFPVAPVAPSASIAPISRASTPSTPSTPSPRLSPPAREIDRPVELEEARELADQGRFEEAADLCDAHLRKHGPTADACFLLGLVRDARGHSPDAERWYRKALYLDQHHEHALLHLALLLERHARPAEARVLRQRLRRVAAILKAAGPDSSESDLT
jgi:chemotaxis protein methyltransferase WspC